jgi:K+-transporting ATPase ATPase B chain
LAKCTPAALWDNPVLELTWWGAAITTLVAIAEPIFGVQARSGGTLLPAGFSATMAVFLWLVLYTATIAESLAEGRGRSQTEALRALRTSTRASRIRHYDPRRDQAARHVATLNVDALDLRPGHFVIVTAGQTLPADGDIVWGGGMVDESAQTGESAPVLRNTSRANRQVISGTRLLSDRMVVKVTKTPGHTATDRMIALAEGTHRQRAPKEMALLALLSSFSLSFVLVSLTLNLVVAPWDMPVSIPILAALVVTLIPTEIAALMSVTGIAAMYQLLRRGVLVDSGHALETAGDVSTVLFDKTGTITEGDRCATRFLPLSGVSEAELVAAALLASAGDQSYEGRSITALAAKRGFADCDDLSEGDKIFDFSAKTRLSGRDCPDGRRVRKGAESAILKWLDHDGADIAPAALAELQGETTRVANRGGTPLVVAEFPAAGPARLLGVIPMRDVVKDAVPFRMEQLHHLGIKTVMITGDNPLTAKAIASEADIDEYIGDADPQAKVDAIVAEQQAGHFVAMSGDGVNDAPALAQADVGVAMNSASPAVRQAANMVILDNDPTKIVDVIEIGRRQQATRGALITFNMANDIMRYFALFPALFAGEFPQLMRLNILHLHSVPSAILSTVIFSIVVMGILIPLALAGVPYGLTSPKRALCRNLLYYGLGGVLVAAAGIKLIDLLVMWIPGY